MEFISVVGGLFDRGGEDGWDAVGEEKNQGRNRAKQMHLVRAKSKQIGLICQNEMMMQCPTCEREWRKVCERRAALDL